MQLYIFMSATFVVSSKWYNERITFDILYISAFCIHSVQFLDFPQMYKRTKYGIYFAYIFFKNIRKFVDNCMWYVVEFVFSYWMWQRDSC